MTGRLLVGKGMISIMEVIEIAVGAMLQSKEITTMEQWRASQQRCELKCRVAVLSALAGDCPDTRYIRKHPDLLPLIKEVKVLSKKVWKRNAEAVKAARSRK
jgi:hypothetical protein